MRTTCRLDRQIDREDITQCVKKLKNNKTGGCDGIVGELLKDAVAM